MLTNRLVWCRRLVSSRRQSQIALDCICIAARLQAILLITSIRPPFRESARRGPHYVRPADQQCQTSRLRYQHNMLRWFNQRISRCLFALSGISIFSTPSLAPFNIMPFRLEPSMFTVLVSLSIVQISQLPTIGDYVVFEVLRDRSIFAAILVKTKAKCT